MIKIAVTATIILLFPAVKSHSQENSRLALKMEYFGEMVMHPGLAAGVAYSMVRSEWFHLHWDNQIGGYVHPWNHTGLFAKSAIGTTFTAPFALFADIGLSAGYLHTFSQGDDYSSNGEGEVEKTTDWGYPHFMPGLFLVFGWDGGKNRDLPFTVYLGPEAFLEIPFNHISLPHVALKVGLTYTLE